MEKDTVDVLFFGSSHAASFFLPQELYDASGITGYNLGCEQQNLVTSYFWLKEALRFQKPEAVVLDCYMLFPFNTEEPLNTAESCTRKAMDYMKWSPVKKEAVSTICSLDENQSLASYYFPNIRYHERWTGLLEDDFSFWKMAAHTELKGYAPQAGYCGREDFTPFETGAAELTDVEKYTAKIRDARYSVFISAKDECTGNLGDSVIKNLKSMGLTALLQGEYGCSYLAVISNGKVVEQSGYQVLEAEGTVRGGRVMYEITSAGNECGNVSSIKIDGNECSKNGRGLNFVVYNHDTKKLVDSVCFDTYEEGIPAIR